MDESLRECRPYDGVFLALYVLQWAAELGLVLLGIRAPGLEGSRLRSQYLYRQMDKVSFSPVFPRIHPGIPE